MYKISLKPYFIEKLEAIRDFIAIDNPIKAEEIYNAILDFINILKYFPLMGRKIDSKKRELIMPKYKYKIVYKVGKNKIAIVSIRREQEKF